MVEQQKACKQTSAFGIPENHADSLFLLAVLSEAAQFTRTMRKGKLWKKPHSEKSGSIQIWWVEQAA